ncbi:SGNH/GDSL hydrolase family protein [Bartonella sp. A05]|uniref:SGNH/GDSL hydrolase family protein n=1 Tax=Bartonella sp. A05 TaxID=2967261 RepID=UPI0022A9D812|nr:SGNH family hydrolase [Bartonella sp. A05]MCZ2203946.1 DUF459 domain-containing protein [Bartonella sp. A05]
MNRFHLMYLICLLFSTLAFIVIPPPPSQAQNFFEFLFNKKQEKPQQQPQIIDHTIYQPQKKTVAQKTLQKKENVKRVLIIGDFVASIVAVELKKRVTDKTDIDIINNAVPASGLVRTDYYSWKNDLPKIIDQNEPDAIVIMIGANDNQPIATSNGLLSPVQPEWISIYKQRIIEIVKILHHTRKPWIWMGQPALKNQSLTQQMQIFNKLYKQETEAAGGYFVDIWDGFISAQGQFSLSGYNLNKETVRLRTDDGINFTPQGKQKLVFYLSTPLDTILNASIFSYENIRPTNVRTQNISQKPYNIERQPPMKLADMAKHDTHLLYKIDQSLIQKPWLRKNGHQINRADNFSYP